jgi:hypothetical protein
MFSGRSVETAGVSMNRMIYCSRAAHDFTSESLVGLLE